MFSTIEVAAKGLLNDPSWNWVFKNTFDAIEDKLNKVWKNIWNSFDILAILADTLCRIWTWHFGSIHFKSGFWRPSLHCQ